MFLCFSIILIQSCQDENIEITPESDYFELVVPPHFPEPDLLSTANPLTKSGIALGRKLFYDPILSGNNKISCASCHDQDKAFSDGISLTDIGFAGTPLLRHSPTLINMAWVNDGVFWDGGSTNLESQAFSPLAAHDEMFQQLYELEEELAADPEYPILFKEAFGEISTANMVKALAQFQRTFVSATSIYDEYVLGRGSLSDDEIKGMELVQSKCQSCHHGVLFTDNLYHNNGLDDDFSSDEHDEIYKGRFRVTRDSVDMGAYKTPTLRNVMISAPYMHDGRFQSIEEVLDHYSDGVKDTPYTNEEVRQNIQGMTGIPLSAEEKLQIIAFLHTLTDDAFLTNTALSNPEK